MSGQQKAARQPAAVNSTALSEVRLETGMVERLVYQGPATQLVVRLANGESLQALVQNQGQPLSWQQGTAIAVHLPPDALRVLPGSA
jgi:hypothetical protein